MKEIEVRYLIVDLEATCWGTPISREETEIIEIGAVMVESEIGPFVDEFAAFVKPVLHPVLSDFCRDLTSITQGQVDEAEGFPHVFSRFLAWAGSEPFTFCSWGDYDQAQFRRDCQLHRIDFPTSLEQHINLKSLFAMQQKIKACGMKRALKRMNMALEGHHHRGIDDARNTARLAVQHILPKQVM